MMWKIHISHMTQVRDVPELRKRSSSKRNFLCTIWADDWSTASSLIPQALKCFTKHQHFRTQICFSPPLYNARETRCIHTCSDCWSLQGLSFSIASSWSLICKKCQHQPLKVSIPRPARVLKSQESLHNMHVS